ncbi:hypothetical protein CYY_005774 [Polysphondylium violaceum]|uniref:RING-type E3 ubiquitin transferase n=1 Tax=Polysphondylium violaceum TaxID=133409 RepID=A0A8J4V3U4_9MYCE|nr:hypothetical protein CYY_005774 [Polysphondylium violaceum]
MGRSKSHNKQYITHTEWVNDFGGKREGDSKNNSIKPLPFNCCTLSLQPFDHDDAMSNDQGYLFDMLNLIPFIKKHGVDPISGKACTIKDYFRVHFSKNSEDKFQCPVLEKEFTDFSHIVVIKTSGNVYSFDAVKKLNIDAKHWVDLLNDTPFKKEDIITIQDPTNRKNLSASHFVQQNIDVQSIIQGSTSSLNNVNEATNRIIKELNDKGIPTTSGNTNTAVVSSNKPTTTTTATTTTTIKKTLTPEEEKVEREFEKFKKEREEKERALKKHSIQAPSFTSTGFSHNQMPTEKHPSETPGKVTKKKGYVQMKTNVGDLNIQLHCDLAPKACENFLTHCTDGYYDGVLFHRVIKNFMAQGGDPTGTGTGGKSIWGRSFKDEFVPSLMHSERGVLSMANSGPNTNNSQFFITFRSTPHLNNVHTIFGKVVGGLDTLKKIEMVSVDDNDRPTKPITIVSTSVLENPFPNVIREEFEEKLKQEKKKNQNKYDESDERGSWFSNPANISGNSNSSTGVGKYLPSASSTTTTSNKRTNQSLNLPSASSTTPTLQQEQQQKKSKTYGNFSNF